MSAAGNVDAPGDSDAPPPPPAVLEYARPPRVRRWRAVWQLPLLWGVPASAATGWGVVHGLQRADLDWFLPLAGLGFIVPRLLRLQYQGAVLVLGLFCGLAMFALVGLLFDVLVEYQADDSWWRRHWIVGMAAALVAIFVLKGESYTLNGLCFAYGAAIATLAALMLGISALWGLYRLWGWVRGVHS